MSLMFALGGFVSWRALIAFSGDRASAVRLLRYVEAALPRTRGQLGGHDLGCQPACMHVPSAHGAT